MLGGGGSGGSAEGKGKGRRGKREIGRNGCCCKRVEKGRVDNVEGESKMRFGGLGCCPDLGSAKSWWRCWCWERICVRMMADDTNTLGPVATASTAPEEEEHPVACFRFPAVCASSKAPAG